MAKAEGKSGVFEALKVWGGIAIIVIVGFAIAYQFVEPGPPGSIVLGTPARVHRAAEAKDTERIQFAARYYTELARSCLMRIRRQQPSAECDASDVRLAGGRDA